MEPTISQRSGKWSRIAALVLVLAGVIGLVTAPISGAVSPSPQDQADAADAALDWIAAELGANGGSIPGFTPGASDWGLTADAILALVAGGRSASTAAVTGTDELAAASDEYTTWAPTMPEVRIAGATAKVLLALRAMGRSPVAAGVDLEAELRSLMVTIGDQRGRFNDRVPDPAWNASNAFGQALAMLALAYAPEGIPSDSVDFLVSQQCPSGGFPLTYTTGGCIDDSAADTDASAMSLQALLTADRTPAVEAALEAGIGWLSSIQDSDSGAFGGTGPTAGFNSNSTGLIAQTLRAAGLSDAADRGAGWIMESTQLSDTNAPGTPAAGDIGAIAYDPAALATALTDGLTSQVADQWRRATAQAVLALGLPIYGPGEVGPVSVPTATTTSTTPTPTTSSSTSTTTVSAVGIDGLTTTTDPTPTTSVGAPIDNDPLDDIDRSSDVQGSQQTRATPTQAGTIDRLVHTGSDPAVPTIIGLTLVLTGALLLTTRRVAPRR